MTDQPDLSHIIEDLRPLAVHIGTLTLDPENARRHPDPNLEAIKDSLLRFGQRKPVVVQAETGVIEAGNGTVVAAQALGWTHVAAVTIRDDAETARAFGLADNRTAELADWDWQRLAESMERLDGTPFDAVSLGWSEAEVADIMRRAEQAGGTGAEGEDDPTPPPDEGDETVSREGDIWVCGPHRVIVGDCRQADLTLLGPIQAVITDPPYGVSYVGKTAEALEIANDEGGDNLVELLDTCIGAILPATKPGASWYVYGPSGVQWAIFLQTLVKYEILRQTLVWVKQSLVMGHSDYHYRHESIAYGWTPGGAHRAPATRDLDTVWEIDKPSRNDVHPTMKPVECMAKPMRDSTLKGEVVLDPFLGSGTTLLAAERLGRVCLGVELSERYADAAIMRWAQESGSEPVLQADGRKWSEVAEARAGD